MRRGARALLWLVLAGVVFVTLSPIDLRPETPFGANKERFAAFFAASLLAMLAYPTHRIRWFSGLVLVAALLEIGQHFAPGRHGRLADFEVKTFGVLCGAAVCLAAVAILPRLGPRRAPR